jgi:acyl-CoA synthetase (NDP forming)
VELLETAKVFSLCPLPRGKKVLAVTASGSLGVMAADRMVEEGLDFVELPASRLSGLREMTPPWMNLRNPLDVGPSGLFGEAMKAALEAPEVDAVLVFPVIPWAVVSSLLRENPRTVESMFVDRDLLEKAVSEKPVIVCVPGHPEWRQVCGRSIFPDVPIVSTPQAAAGAIGSLYRYARWRKRQAISC